MSSRGHGGHGRPGPAPQLLWALPVIVAALIGGLAAAALVHVSLAVALAVSVVIGGIAVFAVSRWPGPQQSQQTQAPPVPQASPVPQGTPRLRAPRASPAPPAAAPSDPVVQLLPVSPGADAPWWDAAQGGPPAPSAAAQRAPAPDLSSYLSSTVIAQCPNCGAFRLDFRRARNGWDFRCESCDYTWTWQPGTPWPPVRVVPP